MPAQFSSVGGGDGGGSGSSSGGSGGAVTIGSNPVFSATLADLAAVASSASYQDVLSGLTTGTRINAGGFVIETVALRDTVTIAAAGNYNLVVNVSGSALASTLGTARATLTARFVRTRGGVDAVLPPRGTPSYARNQYGAYSEILGTHLDMVDAFEAGDKIRAQVLFRSQSTAGTFALSGIESVLSIVGEDSPTVTGGGSTPGWRGPATVADPYVAADVGKHLIEGGVEKVIEVNFHAGHTRVVTMQVLADIGTAVAADGTPHTDRRDLGMFQGFFRRPGDILTADRVDRWRVVLRSGGSATSRSTTRTNRHNKRATGSGSDPFDAGGPWATVHGRGRRRCRSRASFENDELEDRPIPSSTPKAAVTEVGQAFVVLAHERGAHVRGRTPHTLTRAPSTARSCTARLGRSSQSCGSGRRTRPKLGRWRCRCSSNPRYLPAGVRRQRRQRAERSHPRCRPRDRLARRRGCSREHGRPARLGSAGGQDRDQGTARRSLRDVQEFMGARTPI